MLRVNLFSLANIFAELWKKMVSCRLFYAGNLGPPFIIHSCLLMSQHPNICHRKRIKWDSQWSAARLLGWN
jgi:hypothetical protein